MNYYDRCNDRNREAKRQGKQDAFYGYQSHRHDYPEYTERGNAYRDGYEKEHRRIEERHEEERRKEENAAARRIRERCRQDEETYWEEFYAQQEEEQYPDPPEPEESEGKDK